MSAIEKSVTKSKKGSVWRSIINRTSDNHSISLFKLGFYGSKPLVKRFEKAGYPYLVIRYKDEGHVVATNNIKEYNTLMWFINEMAFGRKNYRIDVTYNDVDREPVWWDRIGPEGIYK